MRRRSIGDRGEKEERNKPTLNVYHNLSLSSSSATSPNPCHSPICASPFPACPTPAPTAGCARSSYRGIKHPMTLAASLLTFCDQQFGSDIWQAGLVVHKPDRQWFSGEGFNQLPLAADAERHHIGATELATPKPWFSHDFCLAPFLPSLESCLPAIRWITSQRRQQVSKSCADPHITYREQENSGSGAGSGDYSHPPSGKWTSLPRTFRRHLRACKRSMMCSPVLASALVVRPSSIPSRSTLKR